MFPHLATDMPQISRFPKVLMDSISSYETHFFVFLNLNLYA